MILSSGNWRPICCTCVTRNLLTYLLNYIWCVNEQKRHSPSPGAVVAFLWVLHHATYQTSDWHIYLLLLPLLLPMPPFPSSWVWLSLPVQSIAWKDSCYGLRCMRMLKWTTLGIEINCWDIRRGWWRSAAVTPSGTRPLCTQQTTAAPRWCTAQCADGRLGFGTEQCGDNYTRSRRPRLRWNYINRLYFVMWSSCIGRWTLQSEGREDLRKNWIDTIRQDLKEIGMSWEKAQDRRADWEDWQYCVNQSVFDMGWTKDQELCHREQWCVCRQKKCNEMRRGSRLRVEPGSRQVDP